MFFHVKAYTINIYLVYKFTTSLKRYSCLNSGFQLPRNVDC